MTITTNTMRQGGEYSNLLKFTDEELELAFHSTRFALAYLEGKGEKFFLALTHLRRELEVLAGFRRERKRAETS